MQGASNIVFSNGLLDPWSSGGVTKLTAAERARGLVSVVIPSGAHHLDLFFSNPADPPDVIAARRTELTHIKDWIQK